MRKPRNRSCVREAGVRLTMSIVITAGALLMSIASSLSAAPASPAPPAPKPAAPAAQMAADPIDKVPFFSLAGAAGLPPGFRADGISLANQNGLNNDLRTEAADLIEHDFTFDVILRYYGGSAEREEGFFGIGEGRWTGGAGQSVCLNLHGSQYGDYALLAQMCVPQQAGRDLGTMGKGQAGPWMLRLQKVKKTLTFALGVAPANGAAWEPQFSKTIPDLPAVAPFLDKRSSRLFMMGYGTFDAVRLIVDGKPVVQGDAKPKAKIAPDKGTELPPLFSLVGAAGMPAYLRGTPDALSDLEGVRGGELRTVAKDLLTHDFTFDVLYTFKEKEQSIFYVGIGEGEKSGVFARVHGPGHNGFLPVAISGVGEKALGSVGDSPGPHLLRLEKRGKTLTFLSSPDYKDKFEPTFQQTVPDLAAAAPFLTTRNSTLFVALQGGGNIRALRLSIDGKPADTGIATADAQSGKSTVGASKVPAASSDPIDATPFFYLANSNGLPPFLKADNAVWAGPGGVSGGTCRTAVADLLLHDFSFDLLFEFQNDDDKEIFNVGIGSGATNDGGNLGDSVGSRVHGPGHGGYGTFTISGQAESGIGIFGKTKGPNVLRLCKRGNTFTMSICPDFTDTFKPTVTRTLPDLKASAPFLTAKNSAVFFAGNATFKAVRMTIDGKAAGPGKAIDETARMPAAVAGPGSLLPLKRGPLPTFMEKLKDPQFRKEEAGGLVLANSTYRSKASDYVSKNFTFDVVYRPPPTDAGAEFIVGIGENHWDGNRLQNSIAARIHGPGSDGLVEQSIPETRLLVVGKTGHDVGPHLVRLRKLGNALTIAIWANYDGKALGEPDGIKTIPDIKTTPAALTAKNSQLFIHGTGVVEQLRLVIEGQPVESRDLELAIPPRIVEGKPIKQQVIKPADAALAKGKQFSLEAGPAGLTVSPAGELAWTPTHEQVGRHEVKVKIQSPKETSVIASGMVDVVSAEDANAVKGDLAKVDALHRLLLIDGSYQLTNGAGDLSMLLLEGAQLRRLEIDGFTVRETIKLPKSYVKIGERPTYFVALSDEEKCLDLIDKKSLKVSRSIVLDYQSRFDLALNPTKPVSYVTVEKPAEQGLRSDVLIVEEGTGTVREPDDFVGRWIKVSPDGERLYAAYTEVYRKGSHLLINPDQIHVVPDYGVIDLLIIYDVTAVLPHPVTVKEKMGAYATGIELTRDGSRVSYLSKGGYPTYSNNPAAWDPFDLTKRPASFSAKDHGADATKLSFHPVLPIVALPGPDGVLAFDRETGALQPDRVDLRSSAIPEGTKVRDARFTLDGKYVILDCEDADSKEYSLRKVKLRLSAAELTRIKSYKPKPLAPPVVPKPASPDAAPNRA